MENEDGSITGGILTPEGRVLRKASSILDDIEEAERFAEALNLCGAPRNVTWKIAFSAASMARKWIACAESGRQKMWREIADRYERQGRPRHMAEALAAEDVKAAFKKEAGDIRHVYLAKMGNLREIGARVDSVKSMTQHMEDMENQHRGLLRLFNHRMSDYLKKHNRNIFGNSRNPAQLRNIVRELHGEATGDASARELAEAIRSALEDMRVMFNEAGGLAGKMEDWGLPHFPTAAAP